MCNRRIISFADVHDGLYIIIIIAYVSVLKASSSSSSSCERRRCAVDEIDDKWSYLSILYYRVLLCPAVLLSHHQPHRLRLRLLRH